MDDRRFDTLARILGGGVTRRRALTLLAAALSGGTLFATLPDEAAALTRKQRRRCKRQGGTVCSTATTKARCCTAAYDCLANGSCALTCDPNGLPCPSDDASCSCGVTAEGGSHCRYSVTGCTGQQSCTSTADCPPSQICQNCPTQSTDKRCVAICGYACRSDAECRPTCHCSAPNAEGHRRCELNNDCAGATCTDSATCGGGQHCSTITCGGSVVTRCVTICGTSLG